MEAVRISVVTPSVRPELLSLVEASLKRQTFQDFEWIVVSPTIFHPEIKTKVEPDKLVIEPPKRRGDYYGLNKAWNEGFCHVEGELIVIVCDGVEIQVDTLEKLWRHYESNPKAIISCVGHQYTDLNKPPVWIDPRVRTDQGSFYEVQHSEMEFCVVSFPTKAVYDVGGIDEEYDKAAALSEKEFAMRMYKAGYPLYLCQDIEYKAIQHPRLTPEWDDKYQIAIKMFQKHTKEVMSGKRLKLDYLVE